MVFSFLQVNFNLEGYARQQADEEEDNDHYRSWGTTN